MKPRKIHTAIIALSLTALPGLASIADACTRVTYTGEDSIVLTGRSMDWMTPLHTNLWALPKGLTRDGAADVNSITWTSKYGSIVATAFDKSTTDGMNTAGLVANLLYLEQADYGQRDKARPGLSIAGWVQYVLDNFGSVNEAVTALKQEPFQIVDFPMPDGTKPVLHLSISDASGDSAILEYIDGKLTIHHDRKYQVMTNEPPFEQQLALNTYWQEIGDVMLPGTDRPADRFVRASYYLNQTPQTKDLRTALASMFSIMRNVSVPMGESKPGHPNIAPTLWRTVSDQKNRTYYFESTMTPNVFWVEMDKLNLEQGAPTMRLSLEGDPVYAGDTAQHFVPAQPFVFRSPNT